MNNKYLYPLIAIAAASLGFLAASMWQNHHSIDEVNNDTQAVTKAPVLTLPTFSLKNRNGELQSINSWPGKSLIINFWATWCAPCRREIPMLMSLQKEHAAEGFQLVGIAVDFREDVLKYADTNKIDYPLLIGEQDGLNAVDAFGIEAVGFPYTVFTDAQSNIITTFIGELHQEQTKLILSTINKINRGTLSVHEGRVQLTSELAKLKKPESDEG